MLAARRSRHRTPIRPARPRTSRARILAGLVLALALAATIVTVAGGRQAERVVALDPSGPHRVASAAGSVEVGLGAEPRLVYRASWLLRGPTVSRDPWPGRLPADDLRLSCGRRLPCRADGLIELPVGAVLEVRADGGQVLVSSFDGDLEAVTTGSHEVVLGPVAGVIRVETEGGDVIGHGLAADEIEVRTGAGAVHLGFLARPRSVRIEAGDAPVTVELPPGRYAVSVEGDRAPTIGVDVDGTADSRITVDGRGPVRILHTT